MIWAESYEVFWGVVRFVRVDVVDVYDFIESAYCAGFCGFSVGLKVDVVSFSLIVGLVFV